MASSGSQTSAARGIPSRGAEPVTVRPIPTPGALVRARGDVWIATAVHPAKAPNGGPQHLVRLLSVSEDRHGETTELIWQVEPGAGVLEGVRLPEPALTSKSRLAADEPRTLDAFINAVRWGSITNADVTVLGAPFRSGIEIIDYQLEPLVRALDMPRISLLVADDVGLGKTIEAGLIAQELISAIACGTASSCAQPAFS